MLGREGNLKAIQYTTITKTYRSLTNQTYDNPNFNHKDESSTRNLYLPETFLLETENMEEENLSSFKGKQDLGKGVGGWVGVWGRVGWGG